MNMENGASRTPGSEDEVEDLDLYDQLMAGSNLPEPPHPVRWDRLSAGEVEAKWLALDEWVDWLRRTYGLPASVIPPFWYRHPELVWELSALHLHWIASYDPEQDGSAPIMWHADFANSRNRLREWVATCGTKINTDRPTRQTTWPGEPTQEPIEDHVIGDRMEDFTSFVTRDAQARQRAEDDILRMREGHDRARET